MTHEQAMSALKAGGSEQTRKTFARHGVDPATSFGVLYATIYKLAKQAGTDQSLAQGLWAGGNHDARILATHVADAAAITSAMLERWMKDCRNYVQMDAVSALAMRTPHAAQKARAWIDSRDEFIAAAGWNVVAGLAMADAPEGDRGRVKRVESSAGAWDEAAFAKILGRIEQEISRAPNRVKHSMNNVVISIGMRGGPLRDAAIAAARRIGKVEVDHGDTCCTTPDAVGYILKVEARRKKPSAGASGSNGPQRPVPAPRRALARDGVRT